MVNHQQIENHSVVKRLVASRWGSECLFGSGSQVDCQFTLLVKWTGIIDAC